MPSSKYVAFPASHHDAPAGLADAGPVADHEPIEVSLYLKPRAMGPEVARSEDPRQAMQEARRTLHQQDIETIRRFAAAHHLQVTEADPARRLVRLAGPASAMHEAFKVKLRHHKHQNTGFRYYTGALQLHEDIAPIVESVLGLDTRPVARHKIIIRSSASVSPSYLPNQIGALYGIPATPTGAGECIAIIELGGGYADSDNSQAFTAMGLNPPTVVAVSVDGGSNQFTPSNNANGEVALDIQVAGGIAPGARLAVYFTTNTDAGFADAITQATADTTNKPSVMSISWGAPEADYSQQAMTTMNTALQDAGTAGITVTTAAGDNLATDGLNDGQAHVDFPSASPYALGCGGTSIQVSGGQITNETVWNNGNSGTGGGISGVFPVPSYQGNVSLPPSVNGSGPGRGVPDVAGDADPASGYQIVLGGQVIVVGGTSAVAPLWAGFIALANQAAAKSHGFINPLLYSNASGANAKGFREITSGNNRPSGSSIGYDAGPGWNACTGLGVMIGGTLLTTLSNALAATV
jgi:kumamolisin